MWWRDIAPAAGPAFRFDEGLEGAFEPVGVLLVGGLSPRPELLRTQAQELAFHRMEDQALPSCAESRDDGEQGVHPAPGELRTMAIRHVHADDGGSGFPPGDGRRLTGVPDLDPNPASESGASVPGAEDLLE